jgi:hypothetical protein
MNSPSNIKISFDDFATSIIFAITRPPHRLLLPYMDQAIEFISVEYPIQKYQVLIKTCKIYLVKYFFGSCCYLLAEFYSPEYNWRSGVSFDYFAVSTPVAIVHLPRSRACLSRTRHRELNTLGCSPVADPSHLSRPLLDYSRPGAARLHRLHPPHDRFPHWHCHTR